jgi:hypothetical protein
MDVRSKCAAEGCREQPVGGSRFCGEHSPGTPADGIFPSAPKLCTATTQYGRPCRHQPQPGKDVCWSHDPENAAQRVRNARAGGLAVHSPASIELQELKDELKALIRDVKDGKTPPNVASVLAQLFNVLLRGVEQDRRIRELDDIEERLHQIEERTEARRVA